MEQFVNTSPLQVDPGFTPMNLGPRQRGPLAPADGLGHLSDLVRAMGAGDETLQADEAQLPLPLWRVRQHATLFHEGQRVLNLHVVRAGTLRCVTTAEDGYEQVVSFAGPGEVLGFDAISRGTQPVSAQALEESSVYALPLHDLRLLRMQSPALDRALELALSRQLLRAAEMVEMMAAVAAEARLARFLLWMSARMSELGRSPRRLRLVMCRRDIASVLGVAHETVSRSFGVLADCGCLRVANREVEILDLGLLRSRARCTRHLCEGGHAAPGHAAGPAAPAAARPAAMASWYAALQPPAAVD